MLPRDKQRLEQKRLDDERQLAKENFDNMIKNQMSSRHGRDFVMWILNLLQYNQPNPHNSAQAYRVAAVQGVAIEVYRQIYGIIPGEVEKMIREEVESIAQQAQGTR